MSTSLQAAGGRHLAPLVPEYPYRVLVWECRGDVWKLAEVFEWSTWDGANYMGVEACTEPWPEGVTAMHYVIGEIDDEVRQREIEDAADDEDMFREVDEEPSQCNGGCRSVKAGENWVYTGTQYGGDDESFFGEGRCYCQFCGADGDA